MPTLNTLLSHNYLQFIEKFNTHTLLHLLKLFIKFIIKDLIVEFPIFARMYNK